MRKIFKKALAGIASAALVASLLVGINVTTEVKAEDVAVTLKNWSFAQGGKYNNEGGNEGYIGSVTMKDTNEVLSGYLKTGEESVNETKTATALSTGFDLNIENTGWDCQWSAVTGFETNRINPWSIQAAMDDVDIVPGHIYTVSFKAHANKKKYGYMTFGCDVPSTPPYGEAPLDGSSTLMVLTTADQEFTYTFTNWVEATKLNVTFMLGAFDAQYDFAGNNISNIVTEVENQWKGTVTVTDFSIVDKGVDDGYIAPPPKQTTEAPTVKPTEKPTVKPTEKPTVKPQVKKLTKVKNVKAKKNNKKKSLTIKWGKVKNAKKYQVKVGKKTYNVKKAKLTVKKLKAGKKYVVKVRATATGFKAGAWSKKVTVKFKK